MSIQRYSFTAQRRLECHKEDEGDYVLYTNHLTDKQTALDAQQAANAAEVERLINEQIAISARCKRRIEGMEAQREDGRKLAKESYAAAVKFRGERDAAVREPVST